MQRSLRFPEATQAVDDICSFCALSVEYDVAVIVDVIQPALGQQ